MTFTWDAFEDFLRAYAGLLVDGSMMQSLLIEGLNENEQWKRLARQMDASLVLTASRRDLLAWRQCDFKQIQFWIRKQLQERETRSERDGYDERASC